MIGTLLLDGLVAALLVAMLAYCFVLNRRLGTLRQSQDRMRELIEDFAAATRQAEASIGGLKQTAAEIGGDLQGVLDKAAALRDELKVMIQSGGNVADRLERDLLGDRRAGGAAGRSERKPAPAAAPQAAAKDRDEPRSESERELLQALRLVR